jgi:hypothetical protein
MRKLIALCTMWLIFGVVAAAQQFPKWELFAGYSHEIADIDRSKTHLEGFHVSAAENVNRWFGGVLDFSAHFKRINGITVDTESVAFGPQIAYRKFDKLTPSVHVTLGVVHGSQGFLGNSTSGTHFGVVAGGALDYKLRQKFAIRIIEPDYIRTTFQDLPRNNIRLSTGLVFRFD